MMQGHNQVYKKIVSTDQFSDMITITNEFGGPVDLEVDKKFRTPNKSCLQSKPEKESLWANLYRELTYGPNRIKELTERISQAHISLREDAYEQDRKKKLDQYIQKRGSRGFAEAQSTPVKKQGSMTPSQHL